LKSYFSGQNFGENLLVKETLLLVTSPPFSIIREKVVDR
jgi:hypothetical protein